MKKLTELLSAKQRDAVRRPIESARTLPREAFLDEDFYQFERENVLKNSWMAIGFAAQLPEPGDIVVTTVLGVPVLITRARDNQIRVFHNVCPYDSCEVSMGSQQGLEFIITPYHGWKYSLEGKLLEANYWDGTEKSVSLDVQELDADLLPVNNVQWMSTIFVFLGENLTEFEQENHAVLSHCENTDIDRLTIGENENGEALIHSLSINANWKTVYENYSPNVYHESFVHEMYRISPHSPRVDTKREKTYREINHPSGFLGLCYDNEIGGSFYGETALPPLQMKDGSPNKLNTIANVFPNWVITILGDCARISIFLPTGPASGTQWVGTFFDQSSAHGTKFAKDRKQSARKGIMARKEDNRICESIQRARHSPAVTSQFYSPFWDAMHYTLSNLILDRLEQGEAKIDK